MTRTNQDANAEGSHQHQHPRAAMNAVDIERSFEVLRARHQPTASKLNRVQLLSRIQHLVTVHSVKPLTATVRDMRKLINILSDAGEERVIELLNIEHPLLPATLKAIEMIRSGQDDEQVVAFLSSMPPSVLAEEILEEFTMGLWIAIESFLELDRQLMAAHMEVQEEVEKQIRPRPRAEQATPPPATMPKTASPRRPGRPKVGDPNQDARVVQAWGTKAYRTYADLARALRLDEDVVRKTVGRVNARARRAANRKGQDPGQQNGMSRPTNSKRGDSGHR